MMSILNKIAVLVSLCVMSVMSYAATPVYTENQLAIIVTDDQPNFIIQLSSNPSTGYSWFLQDGDQSIIIPVSHVIQKLSSTHSGVGQPRVEIWTFHVKPEGFIVPRHMKLHFAYIRPWDVQDLGRSLTFNVSTLIKK